jgi:hypothetical protein
VASDKTLAAHKAIDLAEYILSDMDGAPAGEYAVRTVCCVKYLLARLYKLKGESKAAITVLEQCFTIYNDSMKQ